LKNICLVKGIEQGPIGYKFYVAHKIANYQKLDESLIFIDLLSNKNIIKKSYCKLIRLHIKTGYE